MASKRMGGMKLSDFSQQIVNDESTSSKPSTAKTTVKTKRDTKKQKVEAMKTVNIKISQKQQRWLANTAQAIRDNNSEPVPPELRVFPQHLIGIAITLLESQNIDLNQIKNAEDLRKTLNI